MKRTRSIHWIVLLGVLLAGPSALHAQATRTWVSGVGDDVNPCSRTAPCKTFAGAISKTAAQGQINVLDPGAFGGVTITKSITIDASGHFAGVLATSGTSGVIINALSTDVVILRGLTIDGAGSGGHGIRFLAGAALHVENCVINNFAQKGIDIEPSTGMFLYIKDTIVRNNTAGGVANGGGILLKPSGVGSIRAELDNVRSERNVYGLRTETNTETVVKNSVFAGNVGVGINAISATNGNVQINLENTVVSNNTLDGVTASGANSRVRLSNTMVTNNTGTGINPLLGALVQSWGNNRIFGTTPGAFSAPALVQQ
jgi:hypothetical protein